STLRLQSASNERDGLKQQIWQLQQQIQQRETGYQDSLTKIHELQKQSERFSSQLDQTQTASDKFVQQIGQLEQSLSQSLNQLGLDSALPELLSGSEQQDELINQLRR
ncbi:hypothetical protein ABMA58_13080, partial [Oceanospirillum sp. HFRX-1_2]